MSRRTRPAFTLLELLVLLGILAVLLGLLLPAVQKARAVAARMRSGNNLRQIALATHSYHDARRRLPDAVTPPDGRDQTRACASTFVKLLPFLEQEALYQEGMRRGVPALTATVGAFVSPADASTSATAGLTSYVGNDQLFGKAGLSLPRCVPDGASNTILFTERRMVCGDPARRNAWPIAADGTAVDAQADTLAATLAAGQPLQFAPAAAECRPGGASSAQAGGILTALADGSVRTVSSSAASEHVAGPGGRISVWEAALTPDGNEAFDW
jgi:type II secretory pathway pseudopilin PulG